MNHDDPILREIREERTRNAEKYGGDIEAMLQDLKKRQRERGAKLIRLPPKRIQKQPEPSR